MFSTLAHLFTPRKSNNHRPRILHFPGLSILAALIVFGNFGIDLVKARPPKGLILGYASNITASQVLQSTNDQRAKLGLPALRLNAQLSEAAGAKANHMFATNYWAHTAPDGSTPWKFIKASGYKYSVAGENLARDFDDTPSMLDAWMNSPTHRANIVHPKYTETGIAVVNGSLDGIETTLVVHMFGLPAGASAAAKVPSVGVAAAENVPAPAQAKPFEPQVLPTPEVTAAVLSDISDLNKSGIFVSPIDLQESLVLSVVGLLLVVFAIDEIVIRNKKTIRFVGRNMAHIGFLVTIFIIVITISHQGGIL